MGWRGVRRFYAVRGRSSIADNGTCGSAAIVDEGRIGAVFEQPPHQIGEQIAVAADRRIDTAGRSAVPRAATLVKRFSHAIEAAEIRIRHAARGSMIAATVNALWVAICG